MKSLKRGVGSGAGSVSQRYKSPDPHQIVTDPQHCVIAVFAFVTVSCSHIVKKREISKELSESDFLVCDFSRISSYKRTPFLIYDFYTYVLKYKEFPH